MITAIGASGCDSTAAGPAGSVEAHLDLIEARYVSGFGADTFEIELAVLDDAGHTVDSTVVLTDFYDDQAVATLACEPGATQTLQAHLVGAYEGRPPYPVSGVGGLALLDDYTTTTPFTCADAETTTVTWPDDVSDDIAELLHSAEPGFFDFWINVSPPDTFADQDVVITWYLDLHNAAGDVVWWQAVTSDQYGGDHTGSISFVGPCDPDPDTQPNTLRAWPSTMTVDGTPIPHTQWHIDPVEVQRDCPPNRDVAVGEDRDLVLDATPEASP